MGFLRRITQKKQVINAPKRLLLTHLSAASATYCKNVSRGGGTSTGLEVSITAAATPTCPAAAEEEEGASIFVPLVAVVGMVLAAALRRYGILYKTWYRSHPGFTCSKWK